MKHLYKIVQGNHTCLAAESDEREKALRAEGYLLPEELWPPIDAVKTIIRTYEDGLRANTGMFDADLGKPKRKVNGRNSV